jgi:hypothetical protein
MEQPWIISASVMQRLRDRLKSSVLFEVFEPCLRAVLSGRHFVFK